MCLFMCKCVPMYVSMCVCVYVSVSVCLCICVCVYMCVYVCVCICICVYTCAWGRMHASLLHNGNHGDIEYLLPLLSLCSLETDLSLNLKLTDSARYGGQEVARICLF